ncbi:MAG: CHRD domain-containing protein [Pseudomonadota bacterium]|nr:CHRD domain-containing protein [Pseudomonadota bacterium]
MHVARALVLLALAALVPLALAAEPADGAKPGPLYESWLSPMQEGGEESETPKPLVATLGSTAPSTPRAQRASRGYGTLQFTNDLSRARVDVQIEGVKPADIVMFHIHCGPPGVLGPVAVDFGRFGSFEKTFVGGHFTVELTNSTVTTAAGHHGVPSGLPEGCPVEAGLPTQVNTIGGLRYLAEKGVLYFNLHTKAHTYFGEMRGHLLPAPAAAR